MNFEDVQFAVEREEQLRGTDVRTGQYSATISGEKLTALYLVGIDTSGTFSVSAMVESAAATPEKLEELRASMLTFQRVN